MSANMQAAFSLPPGSTEVVLARHGSVSFEGEGLAGGGVDPPLTEAGLLQARALAERLRRVRLDALFASPLRRARETAAAVAEATGVQIVIVDELREVRLGEWEGQLSVKLREGGPVARRLLAEQRWDVVPGAEPHDRFEERVRAGLARIVERAGPGATAVAVVHGGVIAEACRQATGCAGFTFLRSENGSLSRLIHAADGSWALRSFNDVAHLEPQLKECD
jgi:2,3-bisphosphoglycerate-dependent phosphoglycerate mutase